MNISVVIPVFNEEKHIKQVLTALTENTVAPYEIILADGGSTDRTVEIVKRNFPQATVLKNKKRHAAGGRNLGIRQARGEVIAFTDGDCIVAPDWIENIEAAFTRYDIDGMGGKVRCAEPENRYEAYWGNLAWNLIMSFGDEPYPVTAKTLNDAFVTANCAYKKCLLHKLSGFSNYFANNAEDVDLCWRALEQGAKLMYVPDAVIYAHNVTTLRGIAKKSFRNGVSSSKLQKRYGGKWNFDPNIYRMLGENVVGAIRGQQNAALNLVELSCHLAGKYCGSMRAGVINL